MRLRVLLAFLLLFGSALPAAAVSKEIIQLQRDVALLQDTVRALQRSVDEKHAVLRTLIEQSVDAVNRMDTAVQTLQKVVQDSASNSNARVETLAGQVQSLSESVEELKSRLGKLQQQLADTQSVVQSLDAKLSGGATPSTGAPSGAAAATPPPSNLPSAEVLYSTALRDFTSGKYDLARQEFTDYLKYYNQTDLAANAQFYIGETFYAQKDFRRAITEYDKVLEGYPEGSNKQAAAQLKKGYALLELDEREAGVRELRSVIKRFPNSEEARLARERLRRLATTARRNG